MLQCPLDPNESRQKSISHFQQFGHKTNSSAFTNRESTFISGRCGALASDIAAYCTIHVVVWSVFVSVCLFVTFVSPAKTTEPIEAPFLGEGLTHVGPRN